MSEFLVGTHRQVQTAKARGDTGLSKEAVNEFDVLLDAFTDTNWIPAGT